nr:putative ribonuclease H-like domain-containing protein [Tanacetum cinerariifolium]
MTEKVKEIVPEIVDNCKKGLGYENYNAVLPPYTGNFMPLTPDLSFTGLDEFVNKHVAENGNAKSSEEETKADRKNDDALIIEEWVSDNEEENVAQPKVERKDTTKDEASGILKSFITRIENLVYHKVKVIRCDNETEFKNSEMNQFCEMKGILKQFSVARTLQQNKVAGRRNRTLIEADRSFFVGYSLNSKAFRVFNSRTMIVEENLNIRFSENIPNVVGTKACDNAGQARKETEPVKDYILLPLCTADPPFSQDLKSSYDDGSKPSSDDGKKVDGDPSKENEFKDQEKEENVNNTNNVNVAGTNKDNELPFDPNMLVLEDVSIFNFLNDNEDDAPIPSSSLSFKKLNMLTSSKTSMFGSNGSSLSLFVPATLTLNKKDERGIMIRNKERLVAQEYTQEEGIDYDEVFAPVARIKAIRLFLAYASFKDFVVYQMDVKSAFLYEKIKEEVYICQPPGFEDPDFLVRVYKVKKALYRLHQAPRAWYETLSTYLLDNAFQRGKINKTLFIKRHKGDILLVQVYVDDIIFGLTKKELCNAFERLMHEKFQMSSIGELTFFLGLQPLLKNEDGKEVDVYMYRYQVNPKVSHLYVVKRKFRYLKSQPKLDLWYLKDSPLDLVAYTDSDYAGASLGMKSTTGGCQFLRCRLISWQCKKQTVVTNSITEAEYVAASSCYRQVLWIQNLLLDYGYNFLHTKIFINNDSTICIIKNLVFHSKTKHIEIRHHFIRDCNEKKLIQMIKLHTDKNVADLLTKAFHFWSTAMAKTINGEAHMHVRVDGKKAATTASSLEAEQDIGNIAKTQSKRNKSRTHKLKRLYKSSLTARVESLEYKESLGGDASKQGRIKAIDVDEDITLVNVQDDEDMFDVDDLGGEEVFVTEVAKDVNKNVVEEVVNAAQDSVATITVTTEEITLAQALKALMTSKPKVKGIVIHEQEEPSKSTTTTATISKQQSQDKGKGIMIEEPVKHEEAAKRLQAEFDEEERLAKERAQKEQKANIALIET